MEFRRFLPVWLLLRNAACDRPDNQIDVDNDEYIDSLFEEPMHLDHDYVNQIQPVFATEGENKPHFSLVQGGTLIDITVGQTDVGDKNPMSSSTNVSPTTKSDISGQESNNTSVKMKQTSSVDKLNHLTRRYPARIDGDTQSHWATDYKMTSTIRVIEHLVEHLETFCAQNVEYILKNKLTRRICEWKSAVNEHSKNLSQFDKDAQSHHPSAIPAAHVFANIHDTFHEFLTYWLTQTLADNNWSVTGVKDKPDEFSKTFHRVPFAEDIRLFGKFVDGSNEGNHLKRWWDVVSKQSSTPLLSPFQRVYNEFFMKQDGDVFKKTILDNLKTLTRTNVTSSDFNMTQVSTAAHECVPELFAFIMGPMFEDELLSSGV